MYIMRRDFLIKAAKENDVKQIAGLYKCSLENLKHRNALEEKIKKNMVNGVSETKCFKVIDFYKSIIGAIFVKEIKNSLEIRIWIPQIESNLKKEIKESIIEFYKVSGYPYIYKIVFLKENLEQPFSFRGYVEDTNIVLKHRQSA